MGASERRQALRHSGLPKLEPEIGAGREAEQPYSTDEGGAELVAQDGVAGQRLFCSGDFGARKESVDLLDGGDFDVGAECCADGAGGDANLFAGWGEDGEVGAECQEAVADSN
jgi:hypothetical protein